MKRFLLLIPVFFLIALEVVCTKLAFETLGEVDASIYFLATTLNFIPIIFILLNKQKQLATGILLLLAVTIIPYQLYLGSRLISLKEEAANLTSYLYQEKIRHQNYPNDLSAYHFTFPELKKFFRYNKNTDGQFQLEYSIGTESTSHYFNSEKGTWGYYPD